MRITRALAAVSSAVLAYLGFAVPDAGAATTAATATAAAKTKAAPAALAVPVAPTAPGAPTPIPPSGTALALTEDGDMVFGCNGNLYRFDLHGTAQSVVGARVAGAESPTTVLTTRAEDLLGFDPVLGQVSVTEHDPARGELVSPVPGKTFPAMVSFAQDVTVTMEHTPCDDSGTPATFVNTAPFALVNTNAKAFPPHNEVYNNVTPVPFHPIGEPDSPDFVTVLQFPVTVTQTS